MLPNKYSFHSLKRSEAKRLGNISIPSNNDISASKVVENSQKEIETDNKKRAFLKLAGVVGLGAVGSMILPKKASALVFGSTPASSVVGVKDKNNTRQNPATEDGNLATIAGAVSASKMNVNISSGNITGFATESGNLATIAGAVTANKFQDNIAQIGGSPISLGSQLGSASMPVVIASDQAAIPVSGSFSVSNVGIKDASGAAVNTASEESITYLRRIAKLLESMGTIDGATRQRVNVDSWGGQAGVAGTILPIGTGTASTTSCPRVAVSTDSALNVATWAGVAVASGTGASSTGSIRVATSTDSSMGTIAGQNQQMFQDVARNTFATGIRQNLVWA